MMQEIFKYIDRIFAMVRPRRMLYLAIDGVAPRAKMNQQRSRRFRAAQEAREKAERGLKELEKMSRNDENIETDETAANFDSNCITPGTPFMDLVARSLRYYINDRINNEPAWKQIIVILSDASVPGEGEHKIMDYIRKQRLEPNYDPNQQNVIYGLDADLIMLSMATHESRFHVLREDVFADDKTKSSNCYSCGKPGHIADKCPGRLPATSTDKESIAVSSAPKPFIFLLVTVLREYLEAELKPQKQVPFTFNLERAIDDWIFLCFFVGNDFLPHLPCLELREGAIDILLKIYKDLQAKLGGYICDGGRVDLGRAQLVMQGLAQVEPTIFEKRQLKEARRLENISRRKQAELEERPRQNDNSNYSAKRSLDQIVDDSSDHKRKRNNSNTSRIEITTPQGQSQSGQDIIEAQKLIRQKNIEAAKALKNDLMKSESDISLSLSEQTGPAYSIDTKDPDAPIDVVKLWEPGARERYYVSKFNINADQVDEFSKVVAQSYVEGFCWVLAYYYRGCPSWKWFYPFHYAPFAADLVGIADLKIDFEHGEPFRPFDQLMAVFPSASREHIPPAFHHLMTHHSSEIIDFYPEEFLIDMNGKRAAWQGVALLPFIDEIRLLRALETSYPNLTDEERKRNLRGTDIMYTCKDSKLGKWILDKLNTEDGTEIPLEFTPPGALIKNCPIDNCVCIGDILTSHISKLPDITNHQTVAASLVLHSHSLDDYNFNLLQGVIPPERQLSESDVYMTRNGTSSQNFPNILSYGNFSGGSRGNHSMHRDTREQMSRSDGARSGSSYSRSHGDNRTRDYNNNQYNQSKSMDSRRFDNQSRSRGDSYRTDSSQVERFAEYGTPNVPGPYDISSTDSEKKSNHQYYNRYHRR